MWCCLRCFSASHKVWSMLLSGEPWKPETKPAVLSPAAASRWRCMMRRRVSAWMPVRKTRPLSRAYLSSSVTDSSCIGVSPQKLTNVSRRPRTGQAPPIWVVDRAGTATQSFPRQRARHRRGAAPDQGGGTMAHATKGRLLAACLLLFGQAGPALAQQQQSCGGTFENLYRQSDARLREFFQGVWQGEAPDPYGNLRRYN